MRAAIALLAALPVAGLLVAAGLTEAATTPSAVISTDSAWGSGYQDKVTITAGSSAITSWQVEFDLPAGSSMGSYWDAVNAPSGQHQVFTNREYNGSLAAGASTTFGFLVSGSGQPVNCKINGQPCAGGSTPPPTTTTTTTTTTTGTPPPVGAKFSPYIDITSATPTLADVARATGQKSFNLAFALADSTGCTVSWGGTIPLNDARIIGEVNDLKALGGSVTVSTGGAAGPYLENTCGSVAALTAAYEKALDAVGSNSLDVDIEASIPTAMVNQALLAVQQARGTTISYTLRVQAQDYGIDPFSVSILQDAASRGLHVLVNPMIMDFGYSGDWGQAMVSAANATLGQMKSIWPSTSDAQLRASLGLTPMIGVNDSGMVTTKAAAQAVLSFAQSNHIGRLAFWSVGRDNGNCPSGGVSPSCSGISQGLYDFINLYKIFNG
jgi:chitinase